MGLEGKKQEQLAKGSERREREEIERTIDNLRAQIVELGKDNLEEAQKLAARIELLEQSKRELVP